jgi:hypothetical protein
VLQSPAPGHIDASRQHLATAFHGQSALSTTNLHHRHAWFTEGLASSALNGSPAGGYEALRNAKDCTLLLPLLFLLPSPSSFCSQLLLLRRGGGDSCESSSATVREEPQL